MKKGILLLVIGLVVVGALVFLGCSSQEEPQAQPQTMHMETEMSETGTQVKDLACGMTVSTNSAHKATHDGKDYYFCSAGCKDKFVDNPAKYVAH